MSNLLVTAAIGYNWSDVNNLVKSFRRYSSDTIVIITDNLSKNFYNEAKKNNVELFYINLNRYNFINKFNSLFSFFKKNEFSQIRYFVYKEVLKKFSKKKKIIICDSRDVWFQNNPFKKNYRTELSFFLEEQLIKNDKRNKRWLVNTVGIEEYNKIKNNFISCCGVIMGTYNGIKKYSYLMSKYLKGYPYKRPLRHIITFKPIKPYDQGIHNYLIYNNLLKNYEIIKNQFGLVANISHMQKIKKNKTGKMINELNQEYDIIHGYDRKIDFFRNQIMEII